MPRARRRPHHLVLAVAASAALLACSSPQPAHSQGGAVPADSVSRRMMSWLSALSADSMEGRRAGTEGSRRARRWIIGQLQAMGAKPAFQTFEQAVKLPPRAESDTSGANVVVRIPGKSPGGRALVASAHYDHLGVRDGVVFNGADDDASGCVALLTMAERLLRDAPQHDVILVFFDAEESGGHGAKTFVASPPLPLERIAFDLNLDMVSRQDGNALWVAGASHYPFLKPLAEVAAKSSAIPVRLGHDTKDLKPGDDWTGSSDHKAFHDRGVPFLYLGVEDHADYHKSGDDAGKVDPAFYRGAVDFAYALLRSLDAALDSLPARVK